MAKHVILTTHLYWKCYILLTGQMQKLLFHLFKLWIQMNDKG